MRVLHIISEKTWRGGENQVRLLLENSSQEWYVAAPPGSEASSRLRHAATVIELPMDGLQLLNAARILAREVDRAGIQLLDCQSSRGHNLGLFLKLLRPQLKLVVHRRVDFKPGAGFFNRRKYLSPAVDRYVCISAAIADVLGSYGVPRERLRVVPSAVDDVPFKNLPREQLSQTFRAAWRLDPETPVIGNVAYLTTQKDHGTLIRALASVKAEGVKFFCYIAGAGHLEEEHKALAASLGLTSEDLVFLGVRNDVPELLAATDIFALSSRDEGLGTSLLDAIYSGCSLLGTAVGGIPEIIEDELTGLLAPRQRPDIFAAQLIRLLKDKNLRTRLAQAALLRAKSHFSLARMVEGNLAVYREILSIS